MSDVVLRMKSFIRYLLLRYPFWKYRIKGWLSKVNKLSKIVLRHEQFIKAPIKSP